MIHTTQAALVTLLRTAHQKHIDYRGDIDWGGFAADLIGFESAPWRRTMGAPCGCPEDGHVAGCEFPAYMQDALMTRPLFTQAQHDEAERQLRDCQDRLAAALEAALTVPHAFALVLPRRRGVSDMIFCTRCGATRWVRANGDPVTTPCFEPRSEGPGLDALRELRAEVLAIQIEGGPPLLLGGKVLAAIDRRLVAQENPEVAR